MIFNRSISEPIVKDKTWEESWLGPDKGLIISWEKGREMCQFDPELAQRAKDGELVVLGWKGGVEKPIKVKKFGSFLYLAMWQGLRGENLLVDLDKEINITCSRTKVTTSFTSDNNKLSLDT